MGYSSHWLKAVLCALVCCTIATTPADCESSSECTKEVPCDEAEASHCHAMAYCFTFENSDGTLRRVAPSCQCPEGFLGDGWVFGNQSFAEITPGYNGAPFTGCQGQGYSVRVVLQLPARLPETEYCPNNKLCNFHVDGGGGSGSPAKQIASGFFGMTMNGDWGIGAMHHQVTRTADGAYLTLNGLWASTGRAKMSAGIFKTEFEKESNTFPFGITEYAANGKPRVYRWKTETTSAPLAIQATGMQVDSVHFDTTCAKSGCWVIGITYTTGASSGNFNTFYMPKTQGDDTLSYDKSYTAVELATFLPRNFPCGSNVVTPDTTTCCLEGMVRDYRPVQSFVNWTQTFNVCQKDIIIQRPGFETEYPDWNVSFPFDMLSGKFEGMPDSPGVEFRGVVDAYIDQYQATVYLDEVELRNLAGQLKGTVGVEHTVDTFIGIANFRPTGLKHFDPAAHQVNIHLEKTSFFSVSTHGTNDYTFLSYINLRLVSVLREDADFVELPKDFGTRTSRTNSTGAAHYVQVTFTMGPQYRPNLPTGLIPLDSVRAGKGTFFEDAATQATIRHKCVDYMEGELDLGETLNRRSGMTEEQERVQEEEVSSGAARHLLHHGVAIDKDGNKIENAENTLGALDTCHEQSHCFTYTWEKIIDSSTGCANANDCSWKVCQIYNPDADTFCQRESGEIPFKRWCQFNGTDCAFGANATGAPDWFVDSTQGPGTKDFRNCQIGKPGDWLFFIVADGNTCGHWDAEPYQLSKVQRELIASDNLGSPFPEGADAYCQPRNKVVKGCENCGFYKDVYPNVGGAQAARRRALRAGEGRSSVRAIESSSNYEDTTGGRRGAGREEIFSCCNCKLGTCSDPWTDAHCRESGCQGACGNVCKLEAEGTQGPLDGCSDQNKCMKWEFTKTGASVCNGGTSPCEYQVCLTIDLSKELCQKDGTISHTCVKPQDECNPDPDSFESAAEVAGIGHGYTQCQRGFPGDKLQFLLKDGAQCDDGKANIGERLFFNTGVTTVASGGATDIQASCFALGVDNGDNIKSCTGNSNGKECMWEIVVPSCDGSSPVEEVTDSCCDCTVCTGGPWEDAGCKKLTNSCKDPVAGCGVFCQMKEAPPPVVDDGLPILPIFPSEPPSICVDDSKERADAYCVQECINHNPSGQTDPNQPCEKAFCNNGGQCSMSPSSCECEEKKCSANSADAADAYCVGMCEVHSCQGNKCTGKLKNCPDARCNNGGQCTHSPYSCRDICDVERCDAKEKGNGRGGKEGPDVDADAYCVQECIDHNPSGQTDPNQPCEKAFCNNGGQCSMSPSKAACGVSLNHSRCEANKTYEEPDGFETCEEQDQCITWDFTRISSAQTCSGESCEWEVCLKIALSDGNGGCKKTSPISSWCKKDEDECHPSYEDFANSQSVFDIEDTTRMCQTGAGGAVLQFLLNKDGVCFAGANLSYTEEIGDTEYAGFKCRSSTAGDASCSAAPAGRECVWEVTVPECGGGGGTPPPRREFHGIDTCDSEAIPETECVWSIQIPEVCGPDPTCDDGIKNQNETGIDCGGECGECKCSSFNNASIGKYYCGETESAYLEDSPSCVLCNCDEHSILKTTVLPNVCGEWGVDGNSCHHCECVVAGNKCGAAGSDCSDPCTCEAHHPDNQEVDEGGVKVIKKCGDNFDGGKGCEDCKCAEHRRTCGEWPDCQETLDSCKCPQCGTYALGELNYGCRECSCDKDPPTNRSDARCGAYESNGTTCHECNCADRAIILGLGNPIFAVSCGTFVSPQNSSDCKQCTCNPHGGQDDSNNDLFCGEYPACVPCTCALFEKCGEYDANAVDNGCVSCTCADHTTDTAAPCGVWPNCEECSCASHGPDGKKCGVYDASATHKGCKECKCSLGHGGANKTCGNYSSSSTDESKGCVECPRPSCESQGLCGNDTAACRACDCKIDEGMCGVYNADNEDSKGCRDCSCKEDENGQCGEYGACVECQCDLHQNITHEPLEESSVEMCGDWDDCKPCTCKDHNETAQCGTWPNCEACNCNDHGPGNNQCGDYVNDLEDCRTCTCGEDGPDGKKCGTFDGSGNGESDCRECTCKDDTSETPCGAYGACRACDCEKDGENNNKCGDYAQGCRACTCYEDGPEGEKCGTFDSDNDGQEDCEECTCAKYDTNVANNGDYAPLSSMNKPPQCGATFPDECRDCNCKDDTSGTPCGPYGADGGTCRECDCEKDGGNNKCGDYDLNVGESPWGCRECNCTEDPAKKGCEDVTPSGNPAGPCPASASSPSGFKDGNSPPTSTPPGRRTEEECCVPFDCALQQRCSSGARMCVSPTDTPDSFVSFNIPLGIDWFPEASDQLDANVFVEMVINAVDKDTIDRNGNPNGGDDPEQMKTTLFASIPVVRGGVNIFCDGITAKTDLKDVANADIVVGSAASAEELTRLRILVDIASTKLGAVSSQRIDSDSIEAGLMTLVLKGNSSYFDNAGTLRHSLVLEDLITIHIMEPDSCGNNCVFDAVLALLQDLPSDNFNLENNFNALGYALNGAFDFEVSRSALRAHLQPTAALQARCPFNPPRPSSENAFPTTCVTRRDVKDAGFPHRVGALSTAMELEPLTNVEQGTCATALDQEVLFLQRILGASEYTENLAKQYSCVIAQKYKIDGRYKRAFWINPGYEWTPTQTGGQSIFTVSQKIFLFALIRLDEGYGSNEPMSSPPTPSGTPTLSRRRQLLQGGDAGSMQGTGAGSAGMMQEFDVSVKSMMAKSYGVSLDHVATFKVAMRLTDEEVCMATEHERAVATRARLAALVEPHASKLDTVQIVSMVVDHGNVDCAASRRTFRRQLLASGASAAVEMMLVFSKDVKPAFSSAGFAAQEGIDSVEELDVSAAVDTTKPAGSLGSGAGNVVVDDEDDDDDESGSNTAVIAGSAAAGGVVLLGLGGFMYWRANKAAQSEQVDIAGVYTQPSDKLVGESARSLTQELVFDTDTMGFSNTEARHREGFQGV